LLLLLQTIFNFVAVSNFLLSAMVKPHFNLELTAQEKVHRKRDNRKKIRAAARGLKQQCFVKRENLNFMHQKLSITL
jgi:hypothetical protein